MINEDSFTVAEAGGLGSPSSQVKNSPRRNVNDERSRHLRRLDRVWVKNPLYFVTTCVAKRRPSLARDFVATFLIDEWRGARDQHGWTVGSYVIMPDHVHFFCAPQPDAVSLTRFIGRWKEWTHKRLKRECGIEPPLWQREFFDHLIRSDESYSEKWDYVRANPVRAGLVSDANDWPHSGHVHFM